jgi:hypothetical protein
MAERPALAPAQFDADLDRSTSIGHRERRHNYRLAREALPLPSLPRTARADSGPCSLSPRRLPTARMLSLPYSASRSRRNQPELSTPPGLSPGGRPRCVTGAAALAVVTTGAVLAAVGRRGRRRGERVLVRIAARCGRDPHRSRAGAGPCRLPAQIAARCDRDPHRSRPGRERPGRSTGRGWERAGLGAGGVARRCRGRARPRVRPAAAPARRTRAGSRARRPSPRSGRRRPPPR